MLVIYEKKDKTAIFTFNRPKVMNAMNLQLLKELHDVMIDFRDDPSIWVGIFTGAGDRAFSAGDDIKAMDLGERSEREFPWSEIDISKPLIAAINGVALGAGLSVALACDLRIVSDNVRLLGYPEVKLGMLEGAGGTQTLPRIICQTKAAEMLLMGAVIDAQEAYRLGMVNKVVPPEQLMPTARQWAETICQAGPLAVRAAKEAIIKGRDMTYKDGLKLEKKLNDLLRSTYDFHEGARAFSEKRKPVFKGE